MKRKRVLGLVLGLALVLSLCLTTAWAAASGTITFKTADDYEAGTPVTIQMQGTRDHLVGLYYRAVHYTIQRGDEVVKSGTIVAEKWEDSALYASFYKEISFTPDKAGTYIVTVSEPAIKGITRFVNIGEKELASAEFTAVCTRGHVGGTATCHSLAVCTKCGKEYGDYDFTKHNVVLFEAEQPAGCMTDGCRAIYKCKDCNTYFADLGGTMVIGDAEKLATWKLNDSSVPTVGGLLPPTGHTYRYKAIGENQVKRYCANCDFEETATLVVEGGPVENQRLAKLVCASGTDMMVDVTGTEGWELSIEYYMKGAFGRYHKVQENRIPTSGEFYAVIDLGPRACENHNFHHSHDWTFTEWEANPWNRCQGRFVFADFAYHTVFFLTKGGSEVSRQVVEHGQPIASVTDLTREGYTFAGWYTVDLFGRSYDWEEGTPVTRDTVLFAKWTKNTYTVTYQADGASPTSLQLPVDYDDLLEAPENYPSREGYEFAGWWYYGNDPTGELWDFNVHRMPAHDITLEAHWIGEDCNVIFMSDGVVVGGQVVKFGQKASPTDVLASDTELASGTSIASDTDAHLDMLTISKIGHTFRGWYASETFTGDAWDFENDEVTVERLILYAKWEINFYDVNFISDGAVWKTVQASYSSLLQKPKDPQKDNFTFNGWWHKLLSDVKQTWNFDEDRVTGELNLNAIWVPNSIKVIDDDYTDVREGSGDLSANFDVEGNIEDLLTEEEIARKNNEGHSFQFEMVVKNDPETVAAMQGDIAKYRTSDYFIKYGNNIYPVDIELYKNEYDFYGDEISRTDVDKTRKLLTITLTIPEEMKTPVTSGFARHYGVLRVHNGLVTELPTTYNANGTLTFRSDLFSTYLIAYQDVATEADHHGGGTYVPSGKTFHTTLSDILAVYVDGVKLDSKWYTISGSDVTLTQAFLDTLAVGKHHFRAESRTMYADADFYIYGNATTVVSAPTGDAGTVMYAAMSLTALSGAVWCFRRKKNG